MSTSTPPSNFNSLLGCDKKLASRWPQDSLRAAELANLVFSVERETMYSYRLHKAILGHRMHRFTYEPLSAPASRQMFCDAQTDNKIKNEALHFNHCTLAVMLGAPLLAYLSTSCDFRVREYNMYVKPKLPTYSENLGQISSDSLHSVLFLSPSFVPSCATAIDPFKDPGVIIDPSAAQMGFEEIFSCAAEYLREKLDPHPYNSSSPLGFHLGMFHDRVGKVRPSLNDYNDDFQHEVTMRAICNTIFRQIEYEGGPRAIMDLHEHSWKPFLAELRWLLQRELVQLRAQLDGIIFSTLSEEERKDQGEELMSLYDQEGYTKMMALVRNSSC